MEKYKVKYIEFNIGDIVKEKYWISAEPNSCLYGIVLSVIREGYQNVDWIDAAADQVEIYWFQWRSTEILPSCFIDMVSTTNGVMYEKEPE